MPGRRNHPLLFAAIAIALVWLVAWGGYKIAQHAKITADQVSAYAQSLDLSKMSADDRKRALQALADKLNALTLEDRRSLRPDTNLLAEMTDDEKEWFVTATMPTQIKQALNAFEQLPEDQRQKAIDKAMNDLQARASDPNNNGGGQNGPALSPDQQARIRSLGLKTFYAESSAQTKAELAPLLNQLQIQMENGRGMRGNMNQ